MKQYYYRIIRILHYYILLSFTIRMYSGLEISVRLLNHMREELETYIVLYVT